MEIDEKIDEKIEKYERYSVGTLMTKKHVLIDLKEIKQSLPPKQKKVEVPEFVAEWLDKCRKNATLAECLEGSYPTTGRNYEIISEDEDWIITGNNEELLARAWLDGYTVKKEPTIHHLKIGLMYFKAVKEGRKTFEIRKNDRDYKVGDILVLQEYTCGSYTDEQCKVKVTYMTDYEQKDGYVVLGIVPVEENE